MTEIFKLYKYSKSTKTFFTIDLTLKRMVFKNGINVHFLYINNYLIKYLFYTLPTASY